MPGQPRQLLDGEGGIAGVGGDSGADRGGAEVDLAEQRRGLAQPRDVLLHRGEVGVELLAEGHRHRVLQLGAADLQHVGELDALGLEREGELVDRGEQRLGREDDREAQRRRIGVVGRLRHVDVVVRVQARVVAALPSHQLERHVRHHLVGVHVGRGAGAALHGVDHELGLEAVLARDQVAGPVDRLGLLGRQVAEPVVGPRRRLLDEHQRADELGKVPDRHAGDREVLDRPERVHPPVGAGRDVAVAEQVVLRTGGDLRQRDLLRRRDLHGRNGGPDGGHVGLRRLGLPDLGLDRCGRFTRHGGILLRGRRHPRRSSTRPPPSPCRPRPADGQACSSGAEGKPRAPDKAYDK